MLIKVLSSKKVHTPYPPTPLSQYIEVLKTQRTLSCIATDPFLYCRCNFMMYSRMGNPSFRCGLAGCAYTPRHCGLGRSGAGHPLGRHP